MLVEFHKIYYCPTHPINKQSGAYLNVVQCLPHVNSVSLLFNNIVIFVVPVATNANRHMASVPAVEVREHVVLAQ